MSDWNTFKTSFAQQCNDAEAAMSEIKDGGPAFPLTGTQWNPGRDAYEVSPIDSGMTLRDYFAAKAVAGMLAKEGWPVGMETAQSAYIMADCMLRARSQS